MAPAACSRPTRASGASSAQRPLSPDREAACTMTLDSLRSHLADIDVTLFTLSGVNFTVSSAIKLLALFALLLWLAARLRDVTVNRALRNSHFDTGTRQALGAFVRYLVIVVGVAVILQNVGLNLGALGVVAGAISVGVGFGLQNIVSNFVSGIIIMLERPIKVGDRVMLSDIEGSVREIGARRTTVVTNDNIAILVPNQRFIVENVTNLMYAGDAVRLRLPVSLPVDHDPGVVTGALLEAARQQQGVLPEPPPRVLRPSVNHDKLQFELSIWHDPEKSVRQVLTSELNQRIETLLRIPAPTGATA
jgi:small-conductance mechanosensitive channel